MAYHGEILTKPFDFRFTNPGITFVQGGNLNPFGHALFRFGDDIGYIHVDEPLDYPKLIPAGQFRRYLDENNKFVLNKIEVKIPFPQPALRKIEDLRTKQWLWLGIPHNCVTFCEEILQAGGVDWSSITNLPYLATFADIGKEEKAPTNAQSSIQIDGPRTLACGQSSVFTLRAVGLPNGGSCRWWPAVGEVADGLRAVQASDNAVTLRAEKGSGKAVVTGRYRYTGGDAVGRLEVALTAR